MYNAIRDALMKRDKRTVAAVLAIQAVLLAAVLFFGVRGRAALSQQQVPAVSDFHSDFVEFDGSWHVDAVEEPETAEKFDSTVDFIVSEPFALKKGSYTVSFWYESSDDRQAYFTVNGEASNLIDAGTVILSSGHTRVDYSFTVLQDVDSLQLHLVYSGTGSFLLRDTALQPNSDAVKRTALLLLFVFFLMDVPLLLPAWWRRNRILCFELTGIALLMSIPLLCKGIYAGHDIAFHLLRIDGIAQELSLGVFPVRLSSLWLEGYGYPVSIFYGDLLLYFPAALRLCGVTLVSAYKIYLFAVNLLSAVLGYAGFRGIVKSRGKALVMTAAYCTASYHLSDAYVRSAAGEFTAMAFFPLAACAVYKIYAEDCAEPRVRRKNALVLALAMTGILECHVLSTLMVTLWIAVICLVFLRKTLKAPVLRTFCLAVAETVVLNLGFLVPFIDYYFNVPVAVNQASGTAKALQAWGAYIGQYFAVLADPFGRHSVAVEERMAMTPGLVLMAALMAAVCLWVRKALPRRAMGYAALSVSCLWLASNLFPWDALARLPLAGGILAQVQYPWRYIGIASLFLTLLLGELLDLVPQAFGQYALTAVACVCVLCACIYAGQYVKQPGSIFYRDTAEMTTYGIQTGEYVRAGSEPFLLSTEMTTSGLPYHALLNRSGTAFDAQLQAGDGGGWVEFPVFNYKGYVAYDDAGNAYAVTDGDNNKVHVDLPAGFDGTLHLRWREPVYWRIAEIIPVIAALCYVLVFRKELLAAVRGKGDCEAVSPPAE